MKTSVSNLAWGDVPFDPLAERLRSVGIDGIEIAPTAIWPDAPTVDQTEVRAVKARLQDLGLAVSGVQSLLYGHPELQLLDRSTWPSLFDHLHKVLVLAGTLEADVAVFGSPRNRTRGALSVAEADDLARQFFTRLIPVLEDNNVVLTLEPNAPDYGADYLIRYQESSDLAEMIESPWVQPQIDTGCMTMVEEDLAAAVRTNTPAHVHASAPHLRMPPGSVDHSRLAAELREAGYRGWVVLEMLQIQPEVEQAAVAAAEWLVHTYGDDS